MRWNCLGADRSLNALFPLLNFSVYLHFSHYFMQDLNKGTSYDEDSRPTCTVLMRVQHRIIKRLFWTSADSGETV
jgi:hypothetical protein